MSEISREQIKQIYEAVLSGAFYADYDRATEMTGWLRALSAEQPAKEDFSRVRSMVEGVAMYLEGVDQVKHAADTLRDALKLLPSADPRPSERREKQRRVRLDKSLGKLDQRENAVDYDRRKPTERAAQPKQPERLTAGNSRDIPVSPDPADVAVAAPICGYPKCGCEEPWDCEREGALGTVAEHMVAATPEVEAAINVAVAARPQDEGRYLKFEEWFAAYTRCDPVWSEGEYRYAKSAWMAGCSEGWNARKAADK